MFALRDAHEHGATRVSVDGAHVLTGGQDGVVALFPLKRWPQTQPLWARQCHTAAVTFVVLHDSLHTAFSCGRDGHVFLHENIHSVADASASTSRLICRLTGEVRCMFFDAPRRRLFLGGDSLRCLKMSGARFEVQMVPLVVPFPIAAVAVSPCGALLAMASTQGHVGVVSVDDGSGTASATADAPGHAAGVRHVVEKVALSPTAGREDACAYRMQWCRTAGGLFLFVPTAAAVAVLRFHAAEGGAPAKMKTAGMLYGDGLTDLVSVCAYAVTSHRVCCVMAARSGGLFVGKVDDHKFRMARHTSQLYDATEHGTLTDVQVNESNGDVAVGLSTGRVSLLHRAAMKALDEAKEADRRAKREAKRQAGKEAAATHSSAAQRGGEATADTGNDADSEEERRPREKGNPTSKGTARPAKDDFINDDATSSDEDDDGSGGGSSSTTSSSNSDSDSDSDSDLDGDGNLKVRENLQKVVVDLKANNADYMEDDNTDRPSRWREEDPQKVVADAEREARRHQQSASRFLDDEAEEASSSDVESEDAAAFEEDGYGVRHRRRHGGHRSEDEDEDEEGEGEGEDVADGDAYAIPVDGVVPDGRGNAGGSAGSGTAGAAALAAQDYSFQIGATPVGEGESCYLAYNSTGFIRCTREGTTVHFHDMSTPAVRINEKGAILMGALSPVGVGFVVATEARGGGEAAGGPALGESVDEADEEPRLMVYYRTFVALGAQSDWRVRLQPGETVRCMTAGGRFLAVATSRYLRLFSLSGLELAVLSKFPRIVAMAGTSSRKLLGGYKANFDPLAVVFLEGGEHKMEVLDVGTRGVGIPAQVLPLTEMADGSSHQLQWMGWSEDGPLHVADTAGVVRMFTQTWGGAWVPVFDPRAIADQSYNLWIWGVSDECLFAYKSSKTDPAYPVAVASGLPVDRMPLVMPLTRTTATATGGVVDREVLTWDHLLRREIRTDELKRHSSFYTAAIAKHDAVHDAKIKELFQNALRAQRTSRAMDLAMMLELRDNLEDCAKEANSGGHAQLVQKLLTLYEMRLKSKLKRKCELPLEKTMVSERERDELLRKLLVRERNAGRTDTSAQGPPPPQARRTEDSGGARTTPRVVVDVEDEVGARAPASVRRAVSPSPTKSEATTAVTATTDRSPQPAARGVAAPSMTSRRVSFNVPGEESPSLPPKSTATAAGAAAHPSFAPSSNASMASSVATAKPTNPFAAKKDPAAPLPTSAAVVAAKAKAPTQTTLAARPARTTFTTTTAPPRAVVDVIGVDSQTSETQPPASEAVLQSHAHHGTSRRTPDRPTHVASRGKQEVAEEEEGGVSTDGRPGRAADSLSPSGGRASGTTPSAVRKPSFVPKALATRRSPNTAPVDPFLSESPDSAGPEAHPDDHRSGDGGGSPDAGEAVSVHALLDVGHEDSLSTAPRSSSFGEALRKRYREDDEDEDSGGVVVPATSFARV